MRIGVAPEEKILVGLFFKPRPFLKDQPGRRFGGVGRKIGIIRNA